MDNAEPIRTLDEATCRSLLESADLGRLAFAVGDNLEIFPVNYVVSDNEILFRTAPGTKLIGSLLAANIAFETDQVGTAEAWSVVAHGRARMLESEADIERAEATRLSPLAPTVKPQFVAISIDRISGRSFEPGPAPEPPVSPAS